MFNCCRVFSVGAVWGSMDLGTDYCYTGVLLALLRSLTQGVRRVLGEM